MKLFTVHDTKAKLYQNPMFMKTAVEALRAFEQGCKDEKTNLNKYPEDYTLVEIAEFNEENGVITPYLQLKELSKATDYCQ